jgi:geranyl-CoA carboxylase alpha subunit
MSSSTPFHKILIANRGEIALRIIRTARRMGCARSRCTPTPMPGARMCAADQAVRIGAALPARLLPEHPAIIAAAQHSGADACTRATASWPRTRPSRRPVVDAGLVFIGPSPQAIRAMGDKAGAKRLMQVAGVPCIPGYDGEDQSDATLRAEAARIGYPLMIKATAGGGGRGMRLVHRPVSLPRPAQRAFRGAGAFGDPDGDARAGHRAARAHVEIQVFADRHGNAVHLGERDCSVQRRHQKLIEEAPSPLAGSPGAALRRAWAHGGGGGQGHRLRGAGTIECLLDARASSTSWR